ncbi:helix-turn-helix transcriptional regulator [Calothrix sp. FACHB-1219]|uniref:helix-turn-helix transcriptional regulator n=1 Tax=unclassified Calothrix TaxID=2619626 RepID=UPI001686C751|nr:MULTISPECIES: helix-turn-helix transcriptional regulator [unclassified Calothrix]MBD2207820.1 helix-turn-helix transcriptional regulator [Calothrix sp. FACHB-168]MBD2222444.1 helix-turn-helix transcriptional regulator [Calothrix sp. FACHB-1219]
MQKTKIVSRIALLREQIGLTQLELGQLLGVTENSVANWEKGRGSLEWIDRVIKLCKLFQCMPDQLVEYVPDNEPVEVQSNTKKNQLDELRKLINTQEASSIGHKSVSDIESTHLYSQVQPKVKTSFLEDLRKLADTEEPASVRNLNQISNSQNAEV